MGWRCGVPRALGRSGEYEKWATGWELSDHFKTQRQVVGDGTWVSGQKEGSRTLEDRGQKELELELASGGVHALHAQLAALQPFSQGGVRVHCWYEVFWACNG